MGALLSIPLLTSVPSACATGAAFFCTSTAAGALTKSCNCNSSVATRIGYSLILLLNSILAWLMLTDWAVRAIEKWSYDYIKMSCADGECYGLLAVHRICFGLGFFHFILALSLVGVQSTKSRRAALQNGWWGPKVLLWWALVALSFFLPNGFIMFYSRYASTLGAVLFILIGLVLLVDFAHSWSETCLEKWEDTDSALWKYTLIGSTLGLYVFFFAATIVLYVFFSGSHCGLNTFFVTTNLLLGLAVSILSVSPAVQEANPRSGLAQSGMVVAYASYVLASALVNNAEDGACNPMAGSSAAAKTSAVVLGALFTFLAIAYSTSRAATQSTAFNGKKPRAKSDFYSSYAALASQEDPETISEQPAETTKMSITRQALMAAVEAGSLPPSALDDLDEDSDAEDTPDTKDDERSAVKYNYSWFHVIFILATMYVGMLLTNWNYVKKVKGGEEAITTMLSVLLDDGSHTPLVKIGTSSVAMWMRVVSGWICYALYAWSLVAPIVLPDRF